MSPPRRLRALALLLFGALTGCSALDPPPMTLDERLSALPRRGLPLERAVVIRWNRYQVPFIEAQTDHDLAFALGLVHAHLRLTQIRAFKQIAQGRLSEMVGPFAVDADQAIRSLDFGRAAAEMVGRLPARSRGFLEAFAAGLNTYQDRLRTLPPDARLLGLDREPFTPEDLITIGRLVGSDVNWLIDMALLPQRGRPDWPTIWARMLEDGGGQITSFVPGQAGAFRDVALGTLRSGSNAVVVAPEHSASGGALVAGDPHLGLSLPNAWLLAGMRSPSFTGVGLMVPGLPFIAEGRTAEIAWVGTNMRAANSDLYDVAALPADQLTTRQTRIRSRFWFSTSREIRESPVGPVMSDSRYVHAQPGEAIALRWVGHLPTDEIDAMFRVMEAKDAEAFRAALADFAVSPQNFLCADSRGNICHVLATVVPRRPDGPPPSLVLDGSRPDGAWTDLADSRSLPFALNPREGFLASANNRPANTSFPIGFFFSSDERIRRLQQLLQARPRLSLDDLKALQHDTLSPDARELASGLARRIAAEAPEADPELVAELAAFDGDYRADAHGPVVFETLLYHLVPAVYGASGGEPLPNALSGLNHLVRHLLPDLEAIPAERRRALLTEAVQAAKADSRRFAGWGDMHRLPIRHWLANLPVLGGFFRYGDYPIGGSRETVMKTAHGLVRDVTAATYGSQARFVTDMSDPDSSQFVLIGGNDGWLGSENALDQVPLWLKGTYIPMPLGQDGVVREFPTVVTLLPD